MTELFGIPLPALFGQLLLGLVNGSFYAMLSLGLAVIFGLLHVINFAHGALFMLGALLAWVGMDALGLNYWVMLILAPLAVGALGMAVERFALRRAHKYGHVAELLFTFGLAYLIEEATHLIWGRSAVPYRVPPDLDGPLFSIMGTQYPMYRGFMMLVAVAMLVSIWLVLKKTRIGLVIQAALTHPETVEALGHNVPRVFMLVFGGGVALAGLAGVIGGNAFITEPGMAAALGPIVFVIVVVGGMGSLGGAFIASLLIGFIQTFAVSLDWGLFGYNISQVAPVLPYLVMVLMLIVRPKGLMGTREG